MRQRCRIRPGVRTIGQKITAIFYCLACLPVLYFFVIVGFILTIQQIRLVQKLWFAPSLDFLEAVSEILGPYPEFDDVNLRLPEIWISGNLARKIHLQTQGER